MKAEVILHSIVHFYNEASLKEKNTRGTKTNKFIGERLAVISEEMRKNDLAVEKLKKLAQKADVLLFGHDPASLAKVKKAPDYYD